MNWRAIGFYLLPIILGMIVAKTVHFNTDLSAFIIAGDSAEEMLLASEMQSGALSRRYLLSLVASSEDEIELAFVQLFKQQLREIPGVEDVWMPGEQNQVAETINSLYLQHADSMYSLYAEQVLPDIFSEQGLMQRAQFLKKALLSPQGALIKNIALQDPLLLTLEGFKDLGDKMQAAGKADSHYQNMLLQTRMAGLEVKAQKNIQIAMTAVFNELNEQFAKQYQLQYTGVPVFAVATQTLMQGDIVKISIFSSLALLILFLLVFRSFSAMFLVFSLLGIVILTAILITQLVFGYVHGMTVAIGSTLVGICIDYPIHALAHANAVEYQKRKQVISKVWSSMVLGGVTTVIGYIALGSSGYPGFQQVAVYAASGILTSLMLTRFVVPALITSKTTQQLQIPLVKAWVNFCLRYRPGLLALLILILAGCLYGLKSIHWMQDMQELTPELNYLKVQDKQIRQRMTSIEPGRFVMVSGQNVEDTLHNAEQVYPLLDHLKKQGQLTDYFGIYPWLLSASKQFDNQALLKHYLTEQNLVLWQQALKQQGLSVKKLGHFDYLFQQPLDLTQVFKTPVKKLLDSRVVSGNGKTMIIIWLGEHQSQALIAAIDRLPNAQYFSQREMLNKMTKDYTARAQVMLTIGLLIIVLLLIGRYKSIRIALQTLSPAIIAAILILGSWSLAGASVSFLHLVGFLLVVAICVDYGIFYQENSGGDIKLTYQAMAASMLTSALAFGSMLIAESTSLRILATVVALGVILGFLLCPLLIQENNPKKGCLIPPLKGRKG